MAEPRSPLREFRHLDEKLHTVGLSPPEQARWASLRELVAPEPSAVAPGGFDVDAAARALRASLVPAGLGAAAPPAADAPAPETVPPGSDSWEAAPGWPEPAPAVEAGGEPLAAWAPLAQEPAAAEHPATLWDAGPFGPVDPLGDPNAPPPEGAAWDVPAADGTEPTWTAEALPPGSGGEARWEAQELAGEPWDPSAPPGAWEPAAASPDPGEPASAPEAWDGAAPPSAEDRWDPRSLAAELPPGWEPGSPPPAEPAPAEAHGEHTRPAEATDPGWAYGARAELFQATPAELASWEVAAGTELPAGGAAPAAEESPLDSALDAGADPSSAPGAPDLGMHLEPEAGGEAPALEAAAPAGPLTEEAADELLLEEFEPDVSTPEASEAAERLAAAAQAPPVEAGEEPLPGAELLGEDAFPSEPEPAAPPAEAGAEDVEVESFAIVQDRLGGPGADGDPGGSAGFLERSIDFVPPPAEGLQLATASEFLSFVGESPPGVVSLELEQSRAEEIPEVAEEDIEEVLEALAAEPTGPEAVLERPPAPPEEPPVAAPPAQEPEPEPWSAAPPPADAGAEVVSLEEIIITPPPPHAEALAPPLPLPASVAEERHAAQAPPEAQPAAEPEEAADVAVRSPEPPAPEPEAPPRGWSTPRASPAFPVPARTPPMPAAAVAAEPVQPEAPAPPPSHVSGEHRVVLHTIEGQVLRGAIRDADLAAPAIPVVQPNGDTVDVAANRLKALFFMLDPGEAAPAALGTKVRVTFGDGRQVGGMSPDYSPGAPGFFVVPVESRTNTGRIWVYRAAVRQISVG